MSACGIGGHQAGEGGQVGMGVVVRGRLFAAEDDQRVGLRSFGQGLARPGFPEVDQGGGFVECHADLAVVGDAGVLDNRDAHAGSFPARAICMSGGRLQEACLGADLALHCRGGREKGNRQTMLAPGGKTHGDL